MTDKETAAEAHRREADELNAQIAVLRGQVEAAVAAAALANAQRAEGANGGAGGNNGEPATIAKPIGKYNLQTAMGLQGDRITYRAIQVSRALFFSGNELTLENV